MLSQRLRGKSLISVSGIPLLKRVINSAAALCFIDEIVVATTHLPSDLPIKSFCNDLGIKCYQGDVTDVLNRYYEASKDLSDNDTILRWTADNPFAHVDAVNEAYKVFSNRSADYVYIHNLSHLVPEFIQVGVLREMNSMVNLPFDREHVTPWIRKHGDDYNIIELPGNYKGLRPDLDRYFTIDTYDQLVFIEELLSMDVLDDNTLNVTKAYEFIDGKLAINAIGAIESDLKADLDGTLVGDRYPAYIIAEIGQNHNGDINIAKKLIDMSVRCGANAVKFQKRDIPSDLTKEAYDKPYSGPNSFGPTYGVHRTSLELSEEEHRELKEYSIAKGITYFLTPTDIESVNMAERIGVPFYKVASRDLTNIPLLGHIARTGKPVIISTGMASIEDIDDALNELGDKPEAIIILQCISQYPADLENVNLNAMQTMRDKYNKIIGYSDHTPGIIASVAAAIMGAAVIENHVTLSRAMKGTDHAGSLEEHGLRKLIDYIRSSEMAKGDSDKIADPSVKNTKRKLARSLTSKCIIEKGETLVEDMLALKSPGDGIVWRDRDMIIGKRAVKDIGEDVTLKLSDFQ